MMLLLLCIISLLNCYANVFTKSGGIPALQNAQEAVARNDRDASVFYVNYNTTGVLIGVSKDNDADIKSLSYKKSYKSNA